jgi:hypothetical protein
MPHVIIDQMANLWICIRISKIYGQNFGSVYLCPVESSVIWLMRKIYLNVSNIVEHNLKEGSFD